YRTRVGEYAFRQYAPKNGGPRRGLPGRTIRADFTPRTPSVLNSARPEFEAALALYAQALPPKPNPTPANRPPGYHDKALTPIGIGYQHDLRPDFHLYEEFITDYQGRRDALFNETMQVLLDIKNTTDKSQMAATLREHAAGMSAAAETDSHLADSQRE